MMYPRLRDLREDNDMTQAVDYLLGRTDKR